MNEYPYTVKEKLSDLICELSASTVIHLLISTSGNSIYKELLEAQGYDLNTAAASAFVQQRNKILSCAFEFVLHELTLSYSDVKKYR